MRSGFTAVWCGTRGVAAVEFALVASVTLTLLLGLYDVGNAIHERLQLQQALRAGGQYAIAFPALASDTNGANNILTAFRQALPPSWQDVTINITYPPCSGRCIELSASRPYSAFLFQQILTTNSGIYTVRVQ